MHYDALIIGAGPSGLAAAARLSHFGKTVCVLEAHRRPGGLNSWHHVNGREISSGLHAFTNYTGNAASGPLRKLCGQLRLKPADLALKPQRKSSIRFPGVQIDFSNDTEHIRQQVAEKFPAHIDGFDAFREIIRNTDEGEITSRRTSAREVMEKYIADKMLCDMLFCPVMFYGNPGGVGDGKDGSRQRADMDWLLFCVVWKCIFESGFAHPANGMRPLWELLIARITANGGEVRLGTVVARLRNESGKAVAAILEDGTELTAEQIFSSAGGEETRRLLAPKSEATPIPVGSISIVEGIRILDSDAPSLGLEDATVFYSFEKRLEFWRPEGLTCTTNGVVCAPGNYEDIDDNILKVSLLASYPAWQALDAETYLAQKREIGLQMAAALEKLGLNLSGEQGRRGRFGMFDDVFTPLTLERYTSHPEGALYGSAVKSRSGKTECDNLFLIGTDQGFHGIVGAMLSGVAMVNMHCLGKGE